MSQLVNTDNLISSCRGRSAKTQQPNQNDTAESQRESFYNLRYRGKYGILFHKDNITKTYCAHCYIQNRQFPVLFLAIDALFLNPHKENSMMGSNRVASC